MVASQGGDRTMTGRVMQINRPAGKRQFAGGRRRQAPRGSVMTSPTTAIIVITGDEQQSAENDAGDGQKCGVRLGVGEIGHDSIDNERRGQAPGEHAQHEPAGPCHSAPRKLPRFQFAAIEVGHSGAQGRELVAHPRPIDKHGSTVADLRDEHACRVGHGDEAGHPS